MKYVGSKNRHARAILENTLRWRTPGQAYVEPFVGGFNMVDKVVGHRIVGDTHTYLVALFRAIQAGWKPPTTITEDEYLKIKACPKDYPPCLVGFVGFGCSYAGKWFSSYARGNATSGEPRNYAAESYRNLVKQAPALSGVEIHLSSYDKLPFPKDSVVYCDPPYTKTDVYSDGVFDSAMFWDWARSIADRNLVYVSEYKAPDDWEDIWQRSCHNSIGKNTGASVGTERLFVFGRSAESATLWS